MKRPLFLLLLGLVSICLIVTDCYAQDYTITQITDNIFDDVTPQINSKGEVVWSGNDGNDEEIMFYNGSNIMQLTDNLFDDYSPKLNSSADVTWWGFDGNDYEIFLHNGITTTQLTNNNYQDYNPNLNNNGDVAWYALQNNNWEAYLYDGSTTKHLSESTDGDLAPVINDKGNVAWLGGTSSGISHNIFFYDALAESTNDLLYHPHTVSQPQMNANDEIVWQAWDGNDYEIFMHDGLTVKQLTNNSTDDWVPEINDNGQVAWWGFDGNDKEIFLFDGTNSAQITNNGLDDWSVHINNNGELTWWGYDGNDYEVFVYDGSSTKQITDNSFDDRVYQINEDSDLVWYGWDGNDWEIFLANQEELSPSVREYDVAMILTGLQDSDPQWNRLTKEHFEDVGLRANDYFLKNSYGKVGVNFDVVNNVDAQGEAVWLDLDKTAEDYTAKGDYKQFIADSKVKADEEGLLYKIEDGYEMRNFIREGHHNDRLIVDDDFNILGEKDADLANGKAYPSDNDFFVWEITQGGADTDPPGKQIGTLVHETAHLLGGLESGQILPDIYLMGNMDGQEKEFINSDGEKQAVRLGSYDLMATGADNNGGEEPTQLSSFSKEQLGWLQYETFNPGEWENRWNESQPLELKSLGSMNPQENFIPKLQIDDDKYYALEARTKYDDWDKSLPMNGLIVYEVNTDINGDGLNTAKPVTLNANDTLTYHWGMDLKGVVSPGNSYYDLAEWDRGYEFSVLSSDSLDKNIEVEIKEKSIWEKFTDKLKGFVLDSSFMSVRNAVLKDAPLFPSYNIPLPDLDLHLYTLDGSHVGMNYETGIYEVGVQGAFSSGDMASSKEWILLPANLTDFQFFVSSHDTKTFLDAFPELWDRTNGYEHFELLGLFSDPALNTGFASELFSGRILAGKQSEWFIDYTSNGVSISSDSQGQTSVVPEPGTILLFSSGMLGLLFMKKRRKV